MHPCHIPCTCMGQPHLTPPLLEGSRASVGGIRKVGLHWGGPSRPPDRLYPGATKDHRDYVWARTQNVQTQRLCKPEVILSAPQTREFGALLNALNGGSYIYGGPGDDNTGFMAHASSRPTPARSASPATPRCRPTRAAAATPSSFT